MEISKVHVGEQSEKDDEVFAAVDDNLEQGLELLAKYSEDPDIVRPLSDKTQSKKRRHASFVSDGSGKRYDYTQ